MVPLNNAELTNQMWVFTGGAILVLLQSLISGVKRRWLSLLVGCFFGGVGSSIAFHIWGSSPYIPIIAGVAAVVTENLLAGAIAASREFAESPIRVISHFAKMFLPTFGKGVGDASVDDKLK